MKDHLDPQSRIDLIDYKLAKATQTILEADLLAGSSYYNAAIIDCIILLTMQRRH